MPNERDRIRGVLEAFEDKDADTVSDFFAEGGVFIDPHYPEPEYRGREAIREGFEWVFENALERPGFTIRNFWADEDSCAVEVDTHHATIEGTELDFSQVFVIETEDGLITRWQSYPPYGPPSEATN